MSFRFLNSSMVLSKSSNLLTLASELSIEITMQQVLPFNRVRPFFIAFTKERVSLVVHSLLYETSNFRGVSLLHSCHN